MVKKRFQDIVDRLPALRQGAEGILDTLLSNLVLIGEIPAPTFKESRRIQYLCTRFAENGLANGHVDAVGNGIAVLPGSLGERNILLVAHADTVYAESYDHTISVEPTCVIGPGVGDNSLGVAVLAALPYFLEQLDITLEDNLIFLGASRSLGRGNLEGLRYFLDNDTLPISAGICIEGVHLGRLSLSSVAMMRGEINCSVPEQYNWTHFHATGAINAINEVINQINAIALPSKPRSSIAFGSVRGGSGFNKVATEATLRFEIRSETDDMVKKIIRKIKDIVADISSQTESKIEVDVFARRKAGGIAFGHPLSRRTRKILEALNVEHRVSPSTSELFAFIDKAIPAVTIGITHGERLKHPNEKVEIEPMATGMAQLIGMLLAVDGGFCNERS